MATNRRIMTCTLDPRNREPQIRQTATGRILHFEKDDDLNDVADVWIEASREGSGDHPFRIIEAERKFVVVCGVRDIPNGYIHVASTVSNTGDSYHLYELFKELEDIPVKQAFVPIPPVEKETFRELEPILAFRLIVQGKLCGIGEVDRDGAMDLLRGHVDLGHFSASNFIDHALEHRTATLKIEGQGDNQHFIAFTKI